MIEACGDIGISKLVTIMNKIYESGPQQMKESIFIMIPKKGDLLNCSNYRLISLMSHITKILIRILMFRMKKVIHNKINWEQFGFRRNKGTRNTIFVMRSITERNIQMQQDVYAAFIDYEKAFDRLKHIEIMKDVQEMGIDGKDIRVLKNLYWEQMAAISIDGEISEWTYIKRGVRHRCFISPDLFSLYAEIIMRKVKQRSDHLKFTINGMNIQNIRYADDTVLLARNKVDLENLLHILKEENEIRGLNVNRKKKKLMVFSKNKISPKCKITLDNKELQQGESLNYF